MLLKLFNKAATDNETPPEGETQAKLERMDQNMRELGLEVLKLRQEMNAVLTRQQTIKMALGRLREYLEERGALAEAEQDIQVPIQDLLQDPRHSDTDTKGRNPELTRKNKNSLH